MEKGFMIITGIAHAPEQLKERSSIPSGELIYLAKLALLEYKATHLITSLEPGWEQALAKAAIEMEIPFTVAIPFIGRDADWDREARLQYLDLLARAHEVYRVSDHYSENAMLDCYHWRVDRADTVLALWEYEFCGDIFAAMNYAMNCDKTAVNLWQEWTHLVNLRRKNARLPAAPKKRGAQVFGK
jgi:uncharacterized phage-like protein YoqJ